MHHIFFGCARGSALENGFLELPIKLTVSTEDSRIDKLSLSINIGPATAVCELTIAQYSPKSFWTGVPDSTAVSCERGV
jgi:hypothetical protein